MFTPEAPKKSSRLCLNETEKKRRRVATPTSSPISSNIPSPSHLIPSFAAPLSGHSFFANNFITVESLGEGCFGQVKKVLNRSTSERFAIKISKVDPTKVKTGLHYIKDHLQEVRIHSLLSTTLHSNLVQFYLAWKEEGHVYVQLELCADSLYGHWREQNELTTREMNTVFNDMLRALHHLSSLNIVHLDIKPHNILISDKGAFKLADFGKAIELKEKESSSSLDDGSFGDGRYAAPEFLNGHFTTKGDLFSLAISLSQVSVPADAPLTSDEWQKMKNDGNMPDRVCEALTSPLKENIKSMLLPHSSRPSVEDLIEGAAIQLTAVETTAKINNILRDSIKKARQSLSSSCERKLRKNRSPLASQKSGVVFHTNDKFFEMGKSKRQNLYHRSSLGEKRRLMFEEFED